jgi:hypothetical protein
MHLAKTGLIPYWITVQNQRVQHLGVTGYSIADAFYLLSAQGFCVNPTTDVVEIQANIQFADIPFREVRANMGPVIFRGVWYPCLNIGFHRIEAFW